MKKIKSEYNPYVRKKDSVQKVMLDVVLALLPVICISYLAYGYRSLLVIGISVVCALISEFLFSFIFLRQTSSVYDGSAIVTGILLGLTIGPFTPLPIIAFGSASAIVFGKMLWGGLGRNLFNPALMGREFMTIFFPAIMVSDFIYFNPEFIRIQEINWFNNHFINQLIYQLSGAIGEYSVFLLLVGGVYLIIRRRITWHIPFAMMVAFTILSFFLPGDYFIFSLGGVFLGSIYMATDMPTSSSTGAGKLYFGAMVGVICVICLSYEIFRGYLSYAILLMNMFVLPIDRIFRPVVWGRKPQLFVRIGQASLLTILILFLTSGIIWLDYAGNIKYLIYFFILYTLGRYVFSFYNNKNKLKENIL